MERTLAELAKHVNGRLIGDGTVAIHGVNTLEAAGPGEISFVHGAKRVDQALASSASALIIPPEVSQLDGKSGIVVSDPKLAFAQLLELFHPTAPPDGAIHPTAVIGPQARLAAHVSIEAHVTLGTGVSVGSGTRIEAGAVIGDRVAIGSGCVIGPNVVIYRDARIGSRVLIHGGTVIGGDGFGYVFNNGRHVKVPQVGNVVIEDDVEIGCNVCIDRATVGSTVIGQGTKIDNLVQIGHNNRFGKHVIVTGMGGFSGSVTVGDYAVFGGRSSVTDHITIGKGAQIGLCSVVTKSVPAGAVVFGYPARPAEEVKRELAALGLLPKIMKHLRTKSKPSS